MSFEGDLKEAIQKAQTENTQEENQWRSFSTSWEEMRIGMLWRVLKAAERVISDAHLGAHADINNGSIVLEAKWDKRANKFGHALKFSPDVKALQVVCSSSIKDHPSEAYSLENLTEAVVEAKVTQFVYAAVRRAS